MSIISKLPSDILKDGVLPMLEENKISINLKFSELGSRLGLYIEKNKNIYKINHVFLYKREGDNEESLGEPIYFKSKKMVALWIKNKMIYEQIDYDNEDEEKMVSVEYEFEYKKRTNELLSDNNLWVSGTKKELLKNNTIEEMVELLGEIFVDND